MKIKKEINIVIGEGGYKIHDQDRICDVSGYEL